MLPNRPTHPASCPYLQKSKKSSLVYLHGMFQGTVDARLYPPNGKSRSHNLITLPHVVGSLPGYGPPPHIFLDNQRKGEENPLLLLVLLKTLPSLATSYCLASIQPNRQLVLLICR